MRETDNVTKVLAISGSLRPGSTTRQALGVAVEGARKAGAEVTVLEPAQLTLPLFAGDASIPDPVVQQFKAQVKLCDSLLIATPVYHDSFSGSLKNALDFLYDELANKVAALIAVGGGRNGQGQTLEHLRAVLRETGTWTLPRQVIVPSSGSAFDETGSPSDREIQIRLSTLGQELVLRTRQLRPPRVPQTARG